MDEAEIRKQLDLCMGCGYCRDAYGQEGWLQTLKTKHVCPIREVLGFDSYTAKGRLLLGKAILEEELPFTPSAVDIFFRCTLCGNCEAHCISRGLPFVEPDLKVREVIRYFREKIIQEELESPPKLKKLADNIAQHRNVFGEEGDHSHLMPYLKEHPDSISLYFPGCMALFREPQVIKAVDQLAYKLNLDMGCFPEEICCGNILLRTGQVKVARDLVERNFGLFKELKIKKLVTSCPGCLAAFKNEYPKLGFPLDCEVQHISEYLINNPNLQELLMNSNSIKVTYHDPCELGRLNKIYDQPRQLLQAIPALQLIEPFRTRINAWCCGAGAGVQLNYSDLCQKIALDRFNELQESKPDYIVTSCPTCIHCLGQFGKVYDLIELLIELPRSKLIK